MSNSDAAETRQDSYASAASGSPLILPQPVHLTGWVNQPSWSANSGSLVRDVSVAADHHDRVIPRRLIKSPAHVARTVEREQRISDHGVLFTENAGVVAVPVPPAEVASSPPDSERRYHAWSQTTEDTRISITDAEPPWSDETIAIPRLAPVSMTSRSAAPRAPGAVVRRSRSVNASSLRRHRLGNSQPQFAVIHTSHATAAAAGPTYAHADDIDEPLHVDDFDESDPLPNAVASHHPAVGAAEVMQGIMRPVDEFSLVPQSLVRDAPESVSAALAEMAVLLRARRVALARQETRELLLRREKVVSLQVAAAQAPPLLPPTGVVVASTSSI